VNKQVVYMYKGQQIKLVLDTEGTVRIPDKDELVELDGKHYKALTGLQKTTGQAGGLPVYTVYLDEA